MRKFIESFHFSLFRPTEVEFCQLLPTNLYLEKFIKKMRIYIERKKLTFTFLSPAKGGGILPT